MQKLEWLTEYDISHLENWEVIQIIDRKVEEEVNRKRLFDSYPIYEIKYLCLLKRSD